MYFKAINYKFFFCVKLFYDNIQDKENKITQNYYGHYFWRLPAYLLVLKGHR